MQINSTVEWHLLSPQLGNTVGCSSPMQPHGSACLRSLLDDYQTTFHAYSPEPPSTPPAPPRATGSHPQPRQSASWAALQASSRLPDDGNESIPICRPWRSRQREAVL